MAGLGIAGGVGLMIVAALGLFLSDESWVRICCGVSLFLILLFMANEMLNRNLHPAKIVIALSFAVCFGVIGYHAARYLKKPF